MAEIIAFEYNASTEGLVVALDAVNAEGGPYVGKPFPTERVTLSELDPELSKRFRVLLTDLHAFIRNRVPHFAAPDAMVEAHAEMARQKEQHARHMKSVDAELVVKKEQLKALDERLKSSK